MQVRLEAGGRRLFLNGWRQGAGRMAAILLLQTAVSSSLTPGEA